jgi:hypothetical protein
LFASEPQHEKEPAMAKVSSSDESQVIALLKGAFGDFDPKQTLGKIFDVTPAFGRFEWMLTILAIEIDLHVDIPERLAHNRKLTVKQFVAKVAQLPKLTSKTNTLDCLVLLAQALLTLDAEVEDEPKAARGTKSTKTTKKTAKKKVAKKAVAKQTVAKQTVAKKAAKKATKKTRTAR